MPEMPIRGVVVPILTPMTADERVDISSLKRLVDYLIDNGVHGIWASGTTGEFANLPDSERAKSIDAIVDHVAGRVPVIGNITGASTGLSIAMADAVRESGLDGVAATPPYYYPSSQNELLDHYRHIQDRVDLPLWVYNIPHTVKTAVAPETVASLASEGAVVGVKDSSGAGELLAQLNVLCEQGELSLLRFLGTVFRITSAGSLGTHGVIPGIANLVPEICARGWEAGESGDSETARECNAQLMVASKIQGVAKSGITGIKAALNLMGVLDDDTVSRPMHPLTPEEKQQIQSILKDLDLLN